MPPLTLPLYRLLAGANMTQPLLKGADSQTEASKQHDDAVSAGHTREKPRGNYSFELKRILLVWLRSNVGYICSVVSGLPFSVTKSLLSFSYTKRLRASCGSSPAEH